MKKMMMVAVVSAMAGGFATQAFAEPQPMMRKALNQLEDARGLLTFALAAIDAEKQSPRWLDDLRARIAAYLGRSA